MVFCSNSQLSNNSNSTGNLSKNLKFHIQNYQKENINNIKENLKGTNKENSKRKSTMNNNNNNLINALNPKTFSHSNSGFHPKGKKVVTSLLF